MNATRFSLLAALLCAAQMLAGCGAEPTVPPPLVDEYEDVELTGWKVTARLREWPEDTMTVLIGGLREEGVAELRELVKRGLVGNLRGNVRLGAIFDQPYPWHMEQIVFRDQHVWMCPSERPWRTVEEVWAAGYTLAGQRFLPSCWQADAYPLSISDSPVTIQVRRPRHVEPPARDR